jgi:hypothetical protein
MNARSATSNAPRIDADDAVAARAAVIRVIRVDPRLLLAVAR